MIISHENLNRFLPANLFARGCSGQGNIQSFCLVRANRKKIRKVYDLSEIFAEVFAGKSLEKSGRLRVNGYNTLLKGKA